MKCRLLTKDITTLSVADGSRSPAQVMGGVFSSDQAEVQKVRRRARRVREMLIGLNCAWLGVLRVHFFIPFFVFPHTLTQTHTRTRTTGEHEQERVSCGSSEGRAVGHMDTGRDASLRFDQ